MMMLGTAAARAYVVTPRFEEEILSHVMRDVGEIFRVILTISIIMLDVAS